MADAWCRSITQSSIGCVEQRWNPAAINHCALILFINLSNCMYANDHWIMRFHTKDSDNHLAGVVHLPIVVVFYCNTCYRHPCVATEPIMFYSWFIYFFIFIFYSTLVLRNYSTDLHQIFRKCVFWCSLNNPVVLKLFWRHLAEKNAKNDKNLLKISQVASHFWL